MQNGTELMISATGTPTFNVNIMSATQGSHIIKNPQLNNVYYLFTLGGNNFPHDNVLKYSVIDVNLNAGLGAVISKNNVLYNDSITEKMTSTKHCNNKDIWLVIVKGYNRKLKPYAVKKITFLCYLITKNGVQTTPIESVISVNEDVLIMGQMKFNPNGNQLACASGEGISLFSFDKETGKVSLDKFVSLTLQNGYGLEYSPNGKIIYVNEKQYDKVTGILSSFLNYSCPSQLQMANDGKLYKIHFPKAEIISSGQNNDWALQGSINKAFRITQIKNPNLQGIACSFDTSFIYDYGANFSYGIPGLPNFPSYYFYHPKGEFSYSGICLNNSFQFYLKNSPVIADSVKWLFYDTKTQSLGLTASHTFMNAGSQQVSCIVYNAGIADTTTQCVTVCGSAYKTLPKSITQCLGKSIYVNGVSPCGIKYKWNTGDTLSAITITKTGSYVLETTQDCGISKDTVTVNFVYCNPEFEIPNVFTPNGDGVNDVYTFNLKNIKNIEYYIYNRWSTLIKSANETVNIYDTFTKYEVWDGKINNNLYTDGTYFLVLKVTGFDDDVRIHKTFFSLFGNN